MRAPYAVELPAHNSCKRNYRNFTIAILDELKSAGRLAYEMYSEGTFVTGAACLSA